jgi:hypothetical protein
VYLHLGLAGQLVAVLERYVVTLLKLQKWPRLQMQCGCTQRRSVRGQLTLLLQRVSAQCDTGQNSSMHACAPSQPDELMRRRRCQRREGRDGKRMSKVCQ